MPSSVIQYYGEQKSDRCGYCRQKSSSYSHSMHSYILTPEDYQDLVDRGWRRSGHYCYKPNNQVTCCPSYTIRCDTTNFKLTKSHKKILKRINKFLQDGIRPKTDDVTRHDEEEAGCSHEVPDTLKTLRNIDTDNISDSISVQPNEIEQCSQKSNSLVIETASDTKRVQGHDELKPPCKKAKQMRLERKLAKLSEKGVSINITKKESCTKEKTLGDFMNEAPEHKHKLKVILIPSNKGITDEVVNLYRKYQVEVHKDPPQKVTRGSFERFLVRSPIKMALIEVNSEEFFNTLRESYDLYKKYQTHVHNDPPDDGTSEFLHFLQKSPLKNVQIPGGPMDYGYGSFHQQYWLDDHLIAVGVIDILPYCVSSVYFFYDPEYSFLSLGTYGSLREVHFTQKLSEKTPSIMYYYMGFYIHSCPKMRYKGKLIPSYLLCPEVYSWHLLTDEIRCSLDQSKYRRFNRNSSQEDINWFTEADIGSVLLYVNENRCMTYRNYIQLTDDSEEEDNILEYGKLVGKNCAHRMYYVK